MTTTVEVTRKEAQEQMRKCMLDPGRYVNDPFTLACAELLYADTRLHHCYWNNRFCVAVMCNMDEKKQKLAAWCTVSNGLNGYWEWKTHDDYDMTLVLKHLGVVAADFSIERRGLYQTLSEDIAHALAEKFQLPTARWSGATLNAEQLKERDELNTEYPYHRIL